MVQLSLLYIMYWKIYVTCINLLNIYGPWRSDNPKNCYIQYHVVFTCTYWVCIINIWRIASRYNWWLGWFIISDLENCMLFIAFPPLTKRELNGAGGLWPGEGRNRVFYSFWRRGVPATIPDAFYWIKNYCS